MCHFGRCCNQLGRPDFMLRPGITIQNSNTIISFFFKLLHLLSKYPENIRSVVLNLFTMVGHTYSSRCVKRATATQLTSCVSFKKMFRICHLTVMHNKSIFCNTFNHVNNKFQDAILNLQYTVRVLICEALVHKAHDFLE